MKVLANDGLAQSGVAALENAGFEVILTTVAQNQLLDYINTNEVTVLLVRSATTVRTDIIDGCPSLRLLVEAVLVWIILMLPTHVKKDYM